MEKYTALGLKTLKNAKSLKSLKTENYIKGASLVDL